MRAWEVEAFFWADLWKRRHINLWLMIPLYALGLIFHFLVDTIFLLSFLLFYKRSCNLPGVFA